MYNPNSLNECKETIINGKTLYSVHDLDDLLQDSDGYLYKNGRKIDHMTIEFTHSKEGYEYLHNNYNVIPF